MLIITKSKKQPNKQTDKEKYAFLEGWVAKKRSPKKPNNKPKKKKSGAFTLLCPFCKEWVPVKKSQVNETNLKRLIFRRRCPSCKTQLKFVKSSLVFNRYGWVAINTPRSSISLRDEDINETAAQLFRRKKS